MIKAALTPKYSCVISDQDYAKGEVVMTIDWLAHSVPKRTRHSVELCIHGKVIHVEDPATIYMNHSFTPNCHIHRPTGVIYALKTICAGDEVTFNYLTTESEILHPFVDYLTGLIVQR